jgi:acetolactate synthase-1/2/3 large subunit
MLSPDFVAVAAAYGIPGICVRQQADVEAAIEAAYATPGPMLLEFQVEREVNVFPMVAPGASISDMITEGVAAATV